VVAFCFAPLSPLFELARVLVRFDHVASVSNANHGIMRTAEKLEVCHGSGLKVSDYR
jgi:hypothetical protein